MTIIKKICIKEIKQNNIKKKISCTRLVIENEFIFIIM